MNSAPQQIGAYELLAEIGRGGMAIVYRARDTRTSQLVALKVLPLEFAHNTMYLSRFVKEGQNALRLRHKNIVQIFEASEANGYYYIAMELATGGTVADQIKQRKTPMPLNEVLPIIQQVAAGLDYAHKQGFLHRDMKPSNILLTEDGRALISDFGVAREMTADHTMVTMPGFSVGTPAYMSPEQAQGDLDLDGRSDVYSLGVVAYAMLTGKMPFAADSHLVLIRKVVDEFPTPPEVANPRINAHTAYVLKVVLAKNPNDRYTTAGEFAAALAKVGSGGVGPRSSTALDATIPAIPFQPSKTSVKQPRTGSVPTAGPAAPLQPPLYSVPPQQPGRSYGGIAIVLGLIAVTLALLALLRPQLGELFFANSATGPATPLRSVQNNSITNTPSLTNTVIAQLPPSAQPTSTLSIPTLAELPGVITATAALSAPVAAPPTAPSTAKPTESAKALPGPTIASTATPTSTAATTALVAPSATTTPSLPTTTATQTTAPTVTATPQPSATSTAPPLRSETEAPVRSASDVTPTLATSLTSASPTATIRPTETPTAAATPTFTLTPTATATPHAAATVTAQQLSLVATRTALAPTMTATSSSTPTAPTITPTATTTTAPTNTDTPTLTTTPNSAATNAALQTGEAATRTALAPAPSLTSTATATATPLATATATPTTDLTATAAALQTMLAATLTALAPTATPTLLATATLAATPTATATLPSPTATPNLTATEEQVQLAVQATLTALAPTHTATPTALPTATAKPTDTSEPTATATFTATATLTPTLTATPVVLRPYSEGANGFVILLPNGWSQRKVGERVVFISPDRFAQFFVKPIQASQAMNSPQVLLDAFMNNGELTLDDVTVLDSGKTRKIGGRDGYEQNFSATLLGTPVLARLVTFQADGEGYIIGSIIATASKSSVSAWTDTTFDNFEPGIPPTATATATATPTFTAIPLPTATLTPTFTATATATPVPTATATPKPPPPTPTLPPPTPIPSTPIPSTPIPPTPIPPTPIPPTPKPKQVKPTSVPPTPAPPAAPALPGIITDFEKFGQWRRGNQPYATFTQAQEQVHSGRFAAKLAYDFPAIPDNYVVFLRTMPIAGQSSSLSMWVYGDASNHFLNVWVDDAAGHRFQFSFGRVAHAGWGQMFAPIDLSQPWPAGSIDGSNATEIAYPLKFIALVFDATPEDIPHKGTIYFDDLAASTSKAATPVQAAPVQAAPTPAANPASNGQEPSIACGADPATIQPGQTSTLFWTITGVKEVYLDGRGVSGIDKRQVSPGQTTNFTLRVIRKDGTEAQCIMIVQVN